MNTAILKKDLLTSAAFQKLSRSAQLIFLHGITATDDYARIDSDPYWWRANVAIGFTVSEISDCHEECIREGLIFPYTSGEDLYYEIPYVKRTSRFNFRYKLRAIYPNPETGDKEEAATYGELCRVGWADGSQASVECRSAVALPSQCQVVESCKKDLSFLSLEKEQLTTTSQCRRSANAVPIQSVLLNVEPGEQDERLTTRLCRLQRMGVPMSGMLAATGATREEVRSILNKLKDSGFLRVAEQ